MSTHDAAQAVVFKQGIQAATLTRDTTGIRFEYTAEYLAGDGPAVATSLPKTSERIHTSGGAVPPFFAGLLPEGRRLTRVRRSIKASADDELSLLIAIGGDTIGDVQIVAGQALDDTVAPPATEPLLQLPRDIRLISIRESLKDSEYDGVALPGVQDKVSGKMINLPAKRAGERLIVKLNPPEHPLVVRNEAAMLRLAAACHIPTAKWQLATDTEGLDLLIITKFERPAGGGMLAVEDATQTIGLWPADKYNLSAEEAFAGLLAHCAARPVAALDLFRQITFALLTGNGDLHGKNMSIIANADQTEWRVTPAYDLPSTVPYGDNTLALSLGGRRSGISRKKLLVFASAVGVPEKAAVRVLERLLAGTAADLADVSALGIPYDAGTLRSWQKELDYRRRLLA